jgi:hypothetical protein
MVSKKVDIKMNVAISRAGGFSGTSGKQNPIHVCISAIEKGPDNRRVLQGLQRNKNPFKSG